MLGMKFLAGPQRFNMVQRERQVAERHGPVLREGLGFRSASPPYFPPPIIPAAVVLSLK